MEAYDPLNYENLAKSIVMGLMVKAAEPITSLPVFEGAGVYALYYSGNFQPYAPMIKTNPERPIYVGKAVPTGARKGGGKFASEKARELYKRLQEHVNTLWDAENLHPADFSCRYLVVVPVWISLAERFLLEHYQPIWNVVIDGFGNHDPGAGRRAMKRPIWDIVHPGRPWAERLQATETAADILQRMKIFLTQ